MLENKLQQFKSQISSNVAADQKKSSPRSPGSIHTEESSICKINDFEFTPEVLFGKPSN